MPATRTNFQRREISSTEIARLEEELREKDKKIQEMSVEFEYKTQQYLWLVCGLAMFPMFLLAHVWLSSRGSGL